jgi:hypothetical protein
MFRCAVLAERGEVERHCGIARRIEQLLSDLGEKVEVDPGFRTIG